MTTRRFVLRLAVALTPSLLILAGLVAWFELGPRGGPVERDRGDASPTGETASIEAEAPIDPRAPVPSTLAPEGFDDLAAGVLDLGAGEHSISGAVLEPSGEAAPGAEVVLLALDADEDGALLWGELRDAPSDLPRVARDLESRLRSSPRIASSTEGRFDFAGVAPGAFRLVARGDGFSPEVSDVLIVDAERPSASVDLELEQLASISGIVLAPGGSPIEGARIEAEWRAPARDVAAAGRSAGTAWLEAALAQRAATAASDPEGRFVLEGCLGGYHDLRVSASGFAPSTVADAPAGDAVLRIVLRPELFLRGEVVDRAARPIAGAEVRLIHLAADASDAQAVVGADGGPSPRSRAVNEARTDGDGRFAFGGLARGVYRAEVDRPGYVRAIAPIVAVHESNADEENRLVFELEDAHGIRGVVRSSGGEPLGGANVRARYQRGLPSGGDARNGDGAGTAPAAPIEEIESRDPAGRSTRTGADGAFELDGLAAGLYALEVSAGFHRAQVIEDVAAGGEPVEVELDAAVPIEGVVIDRRSGEAIEGAAVGSRPSADGPVPRGRRAVETDAEGRFTIDDPPEGKQVLQVEAEGYQTVETPPIDGGDELTVALERGGAVSGRVHAAAGISVEGLRVSLVRDESSTGRRRVGHGTYTGVDGSYRVLLPESGSYRVLVEGEPFVAATSHVIAVPDPRAQIGGVDIHVQLSATVSGVAIGQDLLPVGGAGVRVMPVRTPDELGEAAVDAGAPERREAVEGGKSAVTDATGAFEVHGLPEGSFFVVARAPGYINARSESFELAPGGTYAVTIEMEPEMTISGSVRSAEGEPIPAAEVRAVVEGESRGAYWSEERTLSSVLGTYRLSRLANRFYAVRVSAEEFASALVENVPAGSDDVHVQLERLVSLAGTVVGEFSGEPAAEYRLRLEFEEPDRLSARERALLHPWRKFRSPDGAFSIDGLPPGPYLVEVDAPGHLDAGALELELPVDEGLADVVIPLREVGLIAGLVLDGSANPVGGATVEALQRRTDLARGRTFYVPFRQRRGGRRRDGDDGGTGRPEFVGRATTRGDGSFFLRGLPDGVYRLSITHDDFVSRELGDYVLENGLGNDASVGVRAFLDRGATLRGSVRGLSEADGGAVTVFLGPNRGGDPDEGAWRRSRPKSARVDQTGRFEIRGLAAGEYSLTIRFRRSSDGSFASVRRVVEIHKLDRERGIIIDLSR